MFGLRRCCHSRSCPLKVMFFGVCLWFVSFLWRGQREGDEQGPCNIPSLDPFDPSILEVVAMEPPITCPVSPQLTYMVGNWIQVNKTLLDSVYQNISMCEYRSLARVTNDDYRVVFGHKVILDLKNREKIYDEFIQVSCFSKGTNHSLIYRNYHLTVPSKSFVEERIAKHHKHTTSTGHRWNVLLVGSDSMSWSSSVRYLPKTREYLLGHLKASELRGYTKVGLNTVPCLIPLLTGLPVIYAPEGMYMDHLRLIFRDYEDHGYTTLFAEDRPDMPLFNSYHRGYRKPVADYYYRPMAMAVAKHMDNMSYGECEKEIFMSRQIIDYLERFVASAETKSFLADTFLVHLGHGGDPAMIRQLDQLYFDLFKSLEHMKVWENTILFFYSDHGARFGDVLKSPVGRLEGRLPMLYIALPQTFRNLYPHFVKNLKQNANKLVTSFDIHQTLLDILNLETGGQSKPGARAQSLFSQISANRSCQSANIPLQFCTCLKQRAISTKQPHIHHTARFLVDEINRILLESGSLCAKLMLHNISTAAVLGTDMEEINSNLSPIYQVSFTTTPGFGFFEGTVKVKVGFSYSFTRQGPISRMNRYGKQSACTTGRLQRIYCYCN